MARNTEQRGAPPSAKDVGAVRRGLLAWYDANRRDLPWRRTRDPYAVWVSEMMLQQTQVATVVAYHERWMKRFPTVSALASASLDDVLHAWQGLGYYSRARNLWRGAQAVVRDHDGRVPKSPAELRALPGIGPYSAGAIASIAHGMRAAIVDGNVARVLSRFYGLRGDPARAPLKAELWARADTLVPEDRPGDFNQAMMELGATVCLPRTPSCGACPLAKRCAAHASGAETDFPELPQRKTSVAVARAACVVVRGPRVLVVQVPGGATRWANMWQFPNTDVGGRETAEAAATRAVRESVDLSVSDAKATMVIRHSVTHHRVSLDVFRAKSVDGAPRVVACRAFAWATPGELAALAMPAAHRKIAHALGAE